MAIQRNSRVLRSLRQAQEVANNGAAGTPNAAMGTPDAPKPIEMSFLSNATSFVDDKGVGHVKVNNGVDWSNILPRDSTVHISYGGSGSNKEILVVPIDNKTSDSPPKDVAPGKSSPNMANHLPEGSGSVGTIEVVVDTGADSTVLIVVGSVLGLVAIVAVIAVAVYGRRIRRRAHSEDQSSTDEALIVGSLPHQPAPPPSALDTDMTPDLWVEGQYQYSPNMSRLQTSLNGTAILSDNKTTPMHDRLTVDAYPTSGRGHRGHGGRGDSKRVDHRKSARLDQFDLGKVDGGRDEHRPRAVVMT
uniref:Peptidase A2 domain-containing protein n=1 Tax=Hyaloperonospora arabidopsidis (strain Emoy2) TaxID=559515 RepID=M4B8Z4_HYAAE